MAVVSGHRKRSLKRSTWPQSVPGQLETIVESPRAQEKPYFPSTSSDTTTRSISECELLDSKQDLSAKGTTDPSVVGHTQMIWYSHHLAQSYNDRERLAGKIEQLEGVCKYQSKTNAKLLDDIRIWRNNYEVVESELIESAQDLEEARAYVRNVETANANLRYALSLLKEEQGDVKKKRWRSYIQDNWSRLQLVARRVGNMVCGASVLKTTSPLPDEPSRRVAMSDRTSSNMHLLSSRNCSQASHLTFRRTEPRVSTPM